jgi:hypothetical protein
MEQRRRKKYDFEGEEYDDVKLRGRGSNTIRMRIIAKLHPRGPDYTLRIEGSKRRTRCMISKYRDLEEDYSGSVFIVEGSSAT